MDTHAIAVVCELEEYCKEHILQIITKARELADICDKEVMTICIGKYDEKELKSLMEYGVNKVVFCEREDNVTKEEYINIVSDVLKHYKPEVVLFPATNSGKAAAAVLSIRLEAGLTADCIDIEMEKDKDFYFCRAAINDSVIAKIQCIHCSMKMCTVKKDVFIKKKYIGKLRNSIERFTYTGEKIMNFDSFLEIIHSTDLKRVQSVDINKYPIVFCIGRGVKNKEVLDRIYSIASLCGAGVIGTRAVVEEGMIDREYQVGQSGKSISPKIYISFGVSGASQHMVGIKNAGVIIAINNDETAPIFDYADYPIVDDLEVIISELEKVALSGRDSLVYPA